MIRAKIIVKGIVHGVGFRSFVKRNADMLDIDGYVKNIPEGVEIVAEADNNLIRHFITKIRQGPQSSKVEDVEIHFEDPSNEYDDFLIF